jgi:drug/metabolite transporter (DMT)-like permease
MSERIGVLAAILSSTIGGMAGATTRFIVADTDPMTLGVFRYGGGFLLLLPIVLALRQPWPRGRDWIGVALLGILFFGIFPVLFNGAFLYTTAAHGSMVLSTLPLLTMLVAALVGVEQLDRRKTVGVLIATGGVALALVSGLAQAPAGAWRGDLLMIAATLCMAFYNVWSRPFIMRAAPLTFLTAGMGCGAAFLLMIVVPRGGFAAVAAFGPPQWAAVAYLAAFGGAAAFYLWVFALQHATPTRVASTIAVNPVSASILAAIIIGEPIGLNLLLGVIAVLGGIWIATSNAPARETKK